MYFVSTVSFFASKASTKALIAFFVLVKLLPFILPEVSTTNTISTKAFFTSEPIVPEAFSVISYVPLSLRLMYFS